MTTREQFQSELNALNEDIIKLANAAGQALDDAVDALYSQDIELARQVIANDKKIDRKELEMNDKTILLIAKQQPVATDLRRVITALKILTDIERMADNAKNIATATIHLGENASIIPNDIRKMYNMTKDMMYTAIQAYKYEDITVARKLAVMDDEVDHLYKTIVSELLGETAVNPDRIQYVMQVAFCARYLERFADHITNIGENILYLVKGENYNLN
ncbi:phosphate signaling complex protein PhoU [Oceanobacillus profundus]|uniref:Phosphate-specific transport system accessory protein PhoU n=1 Tax=Oceanobacillus profundus TaxID=372463 RepID=A0A417YJL4_9BACI|nr:phosphate signaling complex protein PhoU [Oceanobacillus profundus]MBR3118736.1 phosphate signaling complex protein PhoU [Oceanobacillus sp.]PAE31221.1 phosphate transport system regulatory protein PhoU [Paenibacillus sp. 7884-2]MCM3396830.1 phosphate signaling complex protein PhoU [Oceanobacillus profundus]MDO6448130.1 phosphate signaling complex protein PhoU [Oceanobacillus profundus]RHW33181.1 phosphate transport system regulatory protein PhoU [Oceanobacillus profundus]